MRSIILPGAACSIRSHFPFSGTDVSIITTGRDGTLVDSCSTWHLMGMSMPCLRTTGRPGEDIPGTPMKYPIMHCGEACLYVSQRAQGISLISIVITGRRLLGT